MRNARGFTLIEIAVVLVIMGIMATAGLRIATSLLTSAGYRDTRQKMAVIKETLISYLRTNNRLPCPDTKAGFLNTPNPGAISFTLAAPPDGIENRNQPSGTAPDTTQACDSQFGVLPYATLGLSAETATDGFGNLFSYYLTKGYGWSYLSAGGQPAQSSMQGTITITDKDANGASLPPRQVVVVVLSYGANGFGAQTRKGTQISPPPAGNTDELVNTAGAGAFVSRGATDDAAATGGAFDDVIMALSANELVGGLIAEKSQQSLSSNVITAKQDIAAIEAAIQAFVVNNGRYPLAATPGSNPAIQAAGVFQGDVPWADLGVTSKDPWNNSYKYAVSPVLTKAPVALTTFSPIEIGNPSNPIPSQVTFFATVSNALSGLGLANNQTISVNVAIGNRAMDMVLTGWISNLGGTSFRLNNAASFPATAGGQYSTWLLSVVKLPSSLPTLNFQEGTGGTAFLVPFVVFSSGQNNSKFFVNSSQVAQECTSLAPTSPIPPIAPACLGQYENTPTIRDGSSAAKAFVRAPISVPPGSTDPTNYYDDVIDYIPKAVIDAKMP